MLCDPVSETKKKVRMPTECVRALVVAGQCDGARDIRPEFLGDVGWSGDEGGTRVNGSKTLAA